MSFNYVMILTRGNRFQTNPVEHKLDQADLQCVFTNGQDMTLLQHLIWSTFVAELWFHKTKIQDRARILDLVRVLWVTISKVYWQFWHSFLNYTFKSRSIFHPIWMTWRKLVHSVCLKSVSRKPWHLHTLWRFTVPAIIFII